MATASTMPHPCPKPGDARNRPVKHTSSAGSPATLAAYAYDGLLRRFQKTQLPDSTALDFDDPLSCPKPPAPATSRRTPENGIRHRFTTA